MDEPEFGLVMPFVVTEGSGGTLDDMAFVCGWECGAIAVALTDVASLGAVTLSRYVHTVIVPQIDLIAMGLGFRLVQIQPWEEHPEEWSFITLTNLPAEEGDDDLL